VIRLFVIFISAVMAVGCTVVRETQPDRTATEQLILSHAVIDAARQIEADAVAGKKVMLNLSYLKTVDVEFTKGELRDRLLQLGAELVPDADAAQIIVEARSPGLGIDDFRTMIGIPEIPIPVPSVGVFTTPALSVYKYDRQHGKAGISLTGIEVATGKHVFSVGPIIGNAVHSDMRLIGIPIYKNRKYLDR
jgi:hypothetical protein